MFAFVSGSAPRSRLTAVWVIVALVVCLLAAGIEADRAGAEDTFRFEGKPGPGFTAYARTPPECWSEPSGIFASEAGAGDYGSISAEASLFDECGEAWSTLIYYGQSLVPVEHISGMAAEEWEGGFGEFGFEARDPAFGPATLGCPYWSPLPSQTGVTPLDTMTSEVDGTTCTLEWLPGFAPHRAVASSVRRSAPVYSRFVDSLAPVSAGRAGVAVQAFGPKRLGVEDQITLRTRAGRVIGRAIARLEVEAKKRRVAVSLDPATQLALVRRGFLVVRASIRHVDGTHGSGDTTSQLVLRSVDAGLRQPRSAGELQPRRMRPGTVTPGRGRRRG